MPIGLQVSIGDLLKKETIKYVLKVDPTKHDITNTNTYEKQVHRFDEGTPEEWLKTKEDLQEIFRQKPIVEVPPKIAVIKTVLRGEALETFLHEIPTDEEPTEEHLRAGMEAVSIQVFPYRALENQKQWMTRYMKKPYDMKMRAYVTRVDRINSSLQHFPGGTPADIFPEKELLGILEYSLPHVFRNKFAIDGYIPSEQGKQELVKAGENIERFQELMGDEKKETKNNKKTIENFKKRGASEKRGANNKKTRRFRYHCDVHGDNNTHDTAHCRVKRFQEENKSKNSDKGTDKKRDARNSGIKKEFYNLEKKYGKSALNKYIQDRRESSSSSSDSEASANMAESYGIWDSESSRHEKMMTEQREAAALREKIEASNRKLTAVARKFSGLSVESYEDSEEGGEKVAARKKRISWDP